MPNVPDVIDLRETPNEQVLDDLYRTLYLPSFPIPEQQEDPSIWKPLLWGPPLPPPKPILRILVAGNGLTSATRGSLLGFIIIEFFRRSSSGLLTYLAVHPHARRQGIARLLLQNARESLRRDAAQQQSGLSGIFGEVNDPQRIADPRESAREADERVIILSSLGARRVPINYVQPQLGPGRGRSYSLMLVAFPPDSTPTTSLPGRIIQEFLHEFYQSLGVMDPWKDPDFRGAVVGLEDQTLELVSLTGSAEEKRGS